MSHAPAWGFLITFHVFLWTIVSTFQNLQWLLNNKMSTISLESMTRFFLKKLCSKMLTSRWILTSSLVPSCVLEIKSWTNFYFSFGAEMNQKRVVFCKMRWSLHVTMRVITQTRVRIDTRAGLVTQPSIIKTEMRGFHFDKYLPGILTRQREHSYDIMLRRAMSADQIGISLLAEVPRPEVQIRRRRRARGVLQPLRVVPRLPRLHPLLQSQ